MAENADMARLEAENTELRARLSRRTAWRRWLAAVLVVLAVVAVVAATVATWAHRTLFDTDRFMETVQPALDDPAFSTVVSDKVSEQLLVALDIEARVTARLAEIDAYLDGVAQGLIDGLEVGDVGRALISRLERPSITALAVPVSDWLESRVRMRTESFITSEAFTTRFPGLVERIHTAAVALARGDMADLPNVYIAGDEVRLNLVPIIGEALRAVAADIRSFLPDIDVPDVVSDRVDEGREQLAGAVQARLPDDFGQVTLMTADDLGEMQQTTQRLDRWVWMLVILAVVLLALAVLASPNRRRTVLQLAIGVILGFVVAFVVLRRLEAAIISEIATPDGDRAARALLGEVLGSLRTLALIVAAVALVLGVGSYLAGRPAWFARLTAGARQATEPGPEGSPLDRWIAAHIDPLRLGGVAVAAVVFFFTGLDLVPVLIIGLLLALYLGALAAAAGRVPHEEVAVVDAGAEPTG